MFGQIPPTQYDLRFTALGVPVRVHPVFWLTAAFLAWTPGHLDRVVLRILCIFVAILVHELGHAVATRAFGWYPEIVLYFFGGYATTQRHSTWKDITVSVAGPVSGFALYFLARTFGIAAIRNGFLQDDLWLDALGFFMFINLAWNAMNLIPVAPLDGGHISREFFCWLLPRNGLDVSLKVSVLASGAVALWAVYCYQNGRGFLGLSPGFIAVMFGYLCYKNIQDIQNSRRGYW